MDKEDGNISTANEHKTHFDLESYTPIRAKFPARWLKVDPMLCVGIPCKSQTDFEDVGYVQNLYGKVIISDIYMTSGETFMTSPHAI